MVNIPVLDLEELEKKHQERIKEKAVKEEPITKSNDKLEVKVDEATGVTTVRTKNNNPL